MDSQEDRRLPPPTGPEVVSTRTFRHRAYPEPRDTAGGRPDSGRRESVRNTVPTERDRAAARFTLSLDDHDTDPLVVPANTH